MLDDYAINSLIQFMDVWVINTAHHCKFSCKISLIQFMDMSVIA
jgi:hypothetical protein